MEDEVPDYRRYRVAELYQQLASPLEAEKPKRCKLPLSEGEE
jgi:hypothetical protein